MPPLNWSSQASLIINVYVNFRMNNSRIYLYAIVSSFIFGCRLMSLRAYSLELLIFRLLPLSKHCLSQPVSSFIGAYFRMLGILQSRTLADPCIH